MAYLVDNFCRGTKVAGGFGLHVSAGGVDRSYKSTEIREGGYQTATGIVNKQRTGGRLALQVLFRSQLGGIGKLPRRGHSYELIKGAGAGVVTRPSLLRTN